MIGNGTLLAMGANPSETTISGFSSGGYMASQMVVAYSCQIKAAGIFAGGPPGCFESGFSDPLEKCCRGSSELDISAVESTIEKAAQHSSRVDPTSNLHGKPIWL